MTQSDNYVKSSRQIDEQKIFTLAQYEGRTDGERQNKETVYVKDTNTNRDGRTERDKIKKQQN